MPNSELHLSRIPKKQKRLLMTLTRVVDQLPVDQRFSETELNDYLRPIYADYADLRRYLIDFHFMARTPDGTAYWRTDNERMS